MDDIAAIEAAAAVAAAAMSQQPPTSPDLKAEVEHEVPLTDPMPQSPLKRARSPNDENEQGDEKRQKTDLVADLAEAQPNGGGDTDLDEITRMIQQAQESVSATGLEEDHHMPDLGEEPNGIVHDATNDDIVNDIMASLSSGLENGDGEITQDDPQIDVGDDTTAPSDLPTFTQAVPRKTLWSDPIRYTRRTHALPTLGKVAVDVIRTLCENSLEDTIATINDADSDVAKEFTALKSFFYMIRKSFSDTFPLLYATQLDITNPTDREMIRMANLATTCASMFGANELGWPDLSTDFLSIFVPEGQHMPSDVAELYIGLKTQMFLTSLESEQSTTRDQLLQDLFVTGQEEALASHHPDIQLSASERSFLADAEARKAMLFNESGDPDNISALGQQYTYEAYLDSLSTYLNDNMATIEIIGTSHEALASTTDSSQFFNSVPSGLDGLFDLNAVIAEASKAAQNAVDNGGGTASNMDDLAAFLTENISRATEQAREQTGALDIPSAVLSATESATRATQLALQSLQRNQYQPTPVPQANPTSTATQHQQQTYQSQQQSHPQQQYFPYSQQQSGPMQTAYQPPVQTENLPPNQSGTTEMLYEKARQAAAARSSTHARREGSHSTRRPWNPEEEKALMMGLDMVKGPHWSQILSLFGPNGSVSNILADRTQVQLKDKARNLKLFFLKTNSEMPYYLQCVTGELKTRAPGQLAKQAAEERAKLSTEDEKAHINGIMALGSMQNGNGQRPSPASASIPKNAPPRPAPSHSHAHPGTPNMSQPQRPPSTQGPQAAQGHLAAAARTHHPQTHAGQQAHVGQQARVGQVHNGQQARPHQPHTPQKAIYQHHPPTQQHPQHQQQQRGQSIPQSQQQHLSQQAPTPTQQTPQPAQQPAQQAQSQAAPPISSDGTSATPQPPQQLREHTQPQAHLGQSTANASLQPKVEEQEIKQERVSSEDAAILDLARLLQQEPGVVAMASSASAQATGS